MTFRLLYIDPDMADPSRGQPGVCAIEPKEGPIEKRVTALILAWEAEVRDCDLKILDFTVDGEELDYLRQNFTGIPMTAGKRVVWFDLAVIEFILYNLSALTVEED